MADVTNESPSKKQKVECKLPTIELAPGVRIPALGYGVGTAFFKGAKGDDAMIGSVKMALDAGLLHVDEAEMYANEVATGRALKPWLAAGSTPRKDLFVTGKALASIDGLESDSLEASCLKSIDNLGIDYFDLYLIHAPYQADGTPFKKSLSEVWKEMEALVSKGLVKAIGVSNWRMKDIDAIYENAVVKPCLNQVENHPHLQQPKLMEYCAERGIAVASYGGLKPLTHKDLSKDRLAAEVVPRIAAAHGKSTAQILQRWNYQSPPHGKKVVITTTTKLERVQEYLAAFGGAWELSVAEMAEMNAAGNERLLRAFWDAKLDEV